MKNPVENPINVVLSQSKKAIWGVALFSCVVNLLMLTGPMFMLQVYDRVLTSRSVPTLVALFVLIVVLFSFLGLFDFLRTRVLSRVGTKLDIDIMALANKAWIYVGLAAAQRKYRPISDLTVIRQFIGSPGPLSLFDLPWVPFYLAIVYMLHFQLGLLATASAIVVVILTVINDLYTKKLIAESSQAEFQDHDFSELSNRNAEAIVAMGMIKTSPTTGKRFASAVWSQDKKQVVGLTLSLSRPKPYACSFSPVCWHWVHILRYFRRLLLVQ